MTSEDLFLSDKMVSDPFLRPDFVVDAAKYCIFPGFADVHVHFREPGFSYKETISSGTAAAARGGYTRACTMPNLHPVPDSRTHLDTQLAIIEKDAKIRVYPYGAITTEQKGDALAPMEEMEKAVAFSDDGRGVQSAERMEAAMKKAAALDKMIAAHCEDESLLHGGYIHDGVYAAAHGHKGICSQSEWGPIQRDLALAEKTGCAYHVCHISCAESVALIRQAKKRGINVTCETAPHYLTLCEEDIQEDGRFKMNPPLRSRADREALVQGLLDGTIDMIATDHAPHTAEEKGRGLAGSLMGVVGLETAFPVLYTHLVKTGILPLERLIQLLSDNPCRRFGLGACDIRPGMWADFTVFDLEAAYTVDPDTFLTMGRATPFAGAQVWGRCLLTVCDGRIAWRDPAADTMPQTL
ncbi:MAG: dihydroorotase [Clostridiales bacterium]|nr:dihydroorotase [Clostridiales bacterium]